MPLHVRRALPAVLSIAVAVACSSKSETPAPAPGAEAPGAQHRGDPGHVAATPASVAARPAPGPVTAPAGAGADALSRPQPALAELERKAALIRPTAAEVRWKEIPWMGSVVEAQKVAQAEKRPILMWISDDDPLDRC